MQELLFSISFNVPLPVTPNYCHKTDNTVLKLRVVVHRSHKCNRADNSGFMGN